MMTVNTAKVQNSSTGSRVRLDAHNLDSACFQKWAGKLLHAQVSPYCESSSRCSQSRPASHRVLSSLWRILSTSARISPPIGLAWTQVLGLCVRSGRLSHQFDGACIAPLSQRGNTIWCERAYLSFVSLRFLSASSASSSNICSLRCKASFCVL